MHNANVVVRWESRAGGELGEGSIQLCQSGKKRRGLSRRLLRQRDIITWRHVWRDFSLVCAVHSVERQRSEEHCPLQIGPEAKRISEWEQKWRALRTRTEERAEEDGWGMGFYEGFCSAEN